MDKRDEYRDVLAKALKADRLAGDAYERGDIMAARHHANGAAKYRVRLLAIADQIDADPALRTTLK